MPLNDNELEELLKEKTNPIQKIKDIFSDIKWNIKKFTTSVNNLIIYFPLIWKDRDYDHSFIFDLLKFKLDKQAKYTFEKDFHTQAKHDSQRMKLCSRLIDKINEDYYDCEYIDYIDKNIEFISSEKHPGYYEMESTVLEDRLDEYFKKYPLIYKRVINGEGWQDVRKYKENEQDYRERIAHNISHINHSRARKLLFKLLDTHIEGWWV